MKVTKEREIFRDKVSGACYEKAYAFRPLKLIDGMGKPTQAGYVLHLAEVPEECYPEGFVDRAFNGELDDVLGYSPIDFGQQLFVTLEQLEERFEKLGKIPQEIDYEALVQQYSEECVDFSRMSGLKGTLEHTLQRGSQGLFTCWLYVLLQYLEGTGPLAPAKNQPETGQ